MSEPKKPLWERALHKVMGLLDRKPNRLLAKQPPPEWAAMEPLKPLTNSPEDIEFYNDITLADEDRMYRNIERNIFNSGIPTTVFDTRITPMNEKTQERWLAYKGNRTHKEAQEALYQASSKPGFPGGPQVMLPAGTNVIEKEDLHPRDPFRNIDAFKTPFAQDPKNPATAAVVKASLGLPRKTRKQQ